MQSYRLSEESGNCNNILFGRRILFFCAVFFLTGCLLAGYGGIAERVAYLSAGVFCVLFVLFNKLDHSRIALYCAVLFLAMGMTASFYGSLDEDFYRVHHNVVEGTVCERAFTESGKAKYKLEDVTVGGEELRHNVYVYAEKTEHALGDVIRAEGRIRQPARKNYAFDYDMRAYCASENVSLIVYAEYTADRGDSQKFSAKVDRFRAAIGEKLDKLYGEYSGIARAMLIGMDETIDPAEKEAYRRAGISHILCISGLHMGIISGALYFLLKKLRAPRLLRYGLSVAVLIGYAMLAGGSLSVVRAAVMHISLLTAVVVKRRGDMLTALSAAFLTCVLGNPAAIYHLGFQLSYGCVFTIICLADRFGKNKILSAVGVAFCGLLTSSLILWNVNYSIAPLSFLFNLLAVPLAGVTMIVLFAVSLIYCIFGGITVYLGVAGKFLLRILGEIAGWSEQLHWEIPVKGMDGAVMIFAFVMIFLLSKYFLGSRRIRWFCAAILFAAGAVCVVLPREAVPLRIDFLAHEYGDTVVVSDGEECVLIDAASPYGSDYIAAYGLEAKALFLSGDYSRQTAGIDRYAHVEIFRAEELQDGEAYQLNPNVSILPMVSEDGLHADYLIRYDGENVLLYMGAAPQEREYPSAKVVKLSSHSKKNIAFAGKIGAEYVILREHTDRLPAIAIEDAGVVSVCRDKNISVESYYDCGTVLTTNES